jgi:hypothetical protein
MGSQARQFGPSSSVTAAEGGSRSPAPRDAQSRYGNGFLAEQMAGQAQTSGEGTGEDWGAEWDNGWGEEEESGPGTGHSHGHGDHEGPCPPPQAGEEDLNLAFDPKKAGGGLKRTNPEPRKAGEQKRVCLGVTILGVDVSPTALDACEDFVKLTLGSRKDMQERMKKESVTLVIVPSNKKMTDLTQFASLKGTKTFDGRTWDDVRGSGGMSVSGGVWAIAVPEENLVKMDPDTDGYGDGYSVGLHEFAHTLQAKGVTDDERKTILKLYEARKKAGGPWTDAYASSNEWEYFAQATNCYFGANVGQGKNGAQWLFDNDKPMYDFLLGIYGPPPVKIQQAKGDWVVPGTEGVAGSDTAYA